jgi:hypothetical protein
MERDRRKDDETSCLETGGFWISIKFQFSTELFYEWTNDLVSGLVTLSEDPVSAEKGYTDLNETEIWHCMSEVDQEWDVLI